MIMDMPFTFIAEDDERIKKIANFVDQRIKEALKKHRLINTLNAVIMAMMELADEYLEMKDLTENYDRRTLKLLNKLKIFENSLRCA